jgi:hypothetical protein
MHKKLPNIEVLRLYREVYKFTYKFDWCNEKGELWRDVLRKSARREFDLSKDENDYIHVMKMMVTTRECMVDLQEKIFETHMRLVRNVDESRNEKGNEEIQRVMFKEK